MQDRELVSAPTNRSARNGQNTKLSPPICMKDQRGLTALSRGRITKDIFLHLSTTALPLTSSPQLILAASHGIPPLKGTSMLLTLKLLAMSLLLPHSPLPVPPTPPPLNSSAELLIQATSWTGRQDVTRQDFITSAQLRHL